MSSNTDTSNTVTSHRLITDSVIQCNGALVTTRLHGPRVVVAVSGEIDSSNVEQVSGLMHRVVPRSRSVVLDLTDVGFLGVEGLRAIVGRGDECARGGIGWAVVASRIVRKLLHLVASIDSHTIVVSADDARQRLGGPPGDPASGS